MSRQNGENGEEWMGRLRIAVAQCNYKEWDRQLKQQFIHGLYDNETLTEIKHELTNMIGTSTITSDQTLAWARLVQA